MARSKRAWRTHLFQKGKHQLAYRAGHLPNMISSPGTSTYCLSHEREATKGRIMLALEAQEAYHAALERERE